MGCTDVKTLLETLEDAYYRKRDVEATLACVTEDIKWIGTENAQCAEGRAALRRLLEAEVAAHPAPYAVAAVERTEQPLCAEVVMVWITGQQVNAQGACIGVPVRSTLTCVHTADGWRLANVHTSVPSAERKKDVLEKERTEKRRREQILMAGMPGGVAIYRLKKDGRVATDYVSESLARMCGYAAEEFLAYLRQDARINLVAEDVPAVMNTVQKSLKSGSPISVRYRIYSKTHEILYVRLDAKPISDEPLAPDEAAVLYAVHTPVSDDAKHIIEEQQRLRELIDRVPAGIGIYEVNNGKISQNYMNDAFYAMLGTDRESRCRYFGENTMDAAHPEDAPLIKAAIQELLAGRQETRLNYRIRLEGDAWFWLHLTASVIERRPGYLRIYAAVADYNEVKRAQRELESNRVTLETALQSAKVMTWRFDYRHARITDSLTLGEAFGLPKVIENVPQSILDAGAIAEESIPDLRRLLDEVAAERMVTMDTKTKLRGEYGDIWYRQIYTPVYDAAGRYVDCIAIAIDITEQKNREQRYEEQLRLNRAAAQEALATVSYNLTQNTVTEFESAEPRLREILTLGSADAVLNAIANEAEMPDSAPEKDTLALLKNVDTLRGLCKKGKTHFEIRHRMKNDSRWLQTTFDMLVNPYTGDVEAIGFLRDITDVVRTELVVNQLLEVDYQSILIIDLEKERVRPFKHDTQDENLRRILAFQKENGSVRTGLEDFLRRYAVPGTAERAVRENSIEYIRRRLAQAPYYECMYTLLMDGRKRQYRTLYAFLGGDRNVLLSAVQDTTAMYEQEERQKAELSQALAQAEQANHAKTDFMSRMSHDMRTPMNAILGLSALTLDDAKKPDAVRANMGKMRQAADFMLGLINDILDMARIEEGAVVLNLEPYSYSDFLMNMKTMFLPQCEAKGIDIHFAEVERNPTGLVDKIRINQIFFNIFSNAVKYTPTGGSIFCEVRNIVREAGRISGEYVIRDTGIGMTEEFQRRLFQPFAQEDDSVTPELQGSGLGLSITKQLVERMGGHIRVESVRGKGTSVSVWLSFALVEETETPPADRAPDSDDRFAGRRVLLVEDHPLNAQIARRLLEKKKLVVVYAENGRVAVERFEASAPGDFDAVLMDIRMPELSGFDAARQMRALARPDARTVPIVAMSANAYPEDIRKGMDCGMNDYLTKPVEPQKLYEVLRKYL